MSFGGETGRRKHTRWFMTCPKTKSNSQSQTAVHRYLFFLMQPIRNAGSNPAASANDLHARLVQRNDANS